METLLKLVKAIFNCDLYCFSNKYGWNWKPFRSVLSRKYGIYFYRYGQTALHAVARDWHMDIARFFLEHGAIIDKADEYGRTPLHLAASVDHFKMVEFLVLNGGNSKTVLFGA